MRSSKRTHLSCSFSSRFGFLSGGVDSTTGHSSLSLNWNEKEHMNEHGRIHPPQLLPPDESSPADRYVDAKFGKRKETHTVSASVTITGSHLVIGSCKDWNVLRCAFRKRLPTPSALRFGVEESQRIRTRRL